MIKKLNETWKSITIEKVMLVLAAGFAAYNFGMAGGYVEHSEGGHFSYGGLMAGIVVNVSLAIAASRFGSLKGATRTKQAQLAFSAMLFLSPLLVAPVVFYSLPEGFLGVWWLRAIWSLGWAGVADLAIVLAGAVTGKGLIALTEDKAQTASQSGASAEGGAQGAGAVHAKSKRTADALHKECTALAAQYACTEPQCKWTPSVDALVESARAGKSAEASARNSRAGHIKNQHPKPIKVDASLLIDPAKKAGEQ